MHTNTLSNLSLLSGRALLSGMFISAGFAKIGAYAGTAAYMESFGIPGILLPAVIALEILGGLAVLLGVMIRPAAILLGVFTLVAGVVFHSDFAQPMQSILFSKNLAIGGAFLLLFAHGAGDWTIAALGKLRKVPA